MNPVIGPEETDPIYNNLNSSKLEEKHIAKAFAIILLASSFSVIFLNLLPELNALLKLFDNAI